MGLTEQTIFEQFPYWRTAIAPVPPPKAAPVTVFVGCGTSYNLALSLAALANAAGRAAIAVPGGEWVSRPAELLVGLANGACGRLVAQRRDHRDRRRREGQPRRRRLCHGDHRRTDSALAANCDRLLAAETHPAEGIVMTSSASLMLLLGMELLGHSVAALPGRRRARASRQCRRQAALR